MPYFEYKNYEPFAHGARPFQIPQKKASYLKEALIRILTQMEMSYLEEKWNNYIKVKVTINKKGNNTQRKQVYTILTSTLTSRLNKMART